ncbi:MAG: cytochrome b/b6 domain-containing protein [Burkholderiaceae bacterium]|nr:cytochrome b/b6 domain-containing protein [Burkholderiaceae bacterium]
MAERSVRIYSIFERFWHWAQALSIFVLLVSGLRITGLHHAISFKLAFTLHVGAAILLLVVWAFAIFWLMTTGAWRHYIPTAHGLLKVLRFYMYEVFEGAPHPYRKVYWHKHNPLQVLAYLALKFVLFPAIWITGLFYLTYGFWATSPARASWLPAIANVHIMAGFFIAAFVIVHVYLLTIGGDFKGHVRPMMTGFDKVNLTEAEEAYLTQDQPEQIKPEP